MATPEAMFSAWFVKNLPDAWDHQRIETTTGRGVPDLNVCTPKGECWIELKRRR